jgi:hypothetical protein
VVSSVAGADEVEDYGAEEEGGWGWGGIGYGEWDDGVETTLLVGRRKERDMCGQKLGCFCIFISERACMFFVGGLIEMIYQLFGACSVNCGVNDE